jgi:serine/threonine-protein kinase ULK4
VPGTTIALVASILRKGEDDVIQHYALKTIENISSQGGDWASRFTTLEVLTNLVHTFKSAAKPESIRATAGSCLVRLVRFSPAVIPSVLDKLPFKDLVAGLARGSVREQQVSLNLLNMALVGSSVINNMGRYILSLLEERTLVPSLIALLEQGLEVLRGKAFICAGLLCKINRRWLPSLCNAKLMPIVERAAKEKDSYVQQCVEALLQMIVSVVPGILESISSDIVQLASSKRPGNLTPGRGQPRSSIFLFPVVLHLFNSPTSRSRLISEQIMKQFVGFLKQVEKLTFQVRNLTLLFY